MKAMFEKVPTYRMRREAVLDRMKSLRLTFNDVGRAVQCSGGYVSKLANGQRNASLEMAERINKTLQVTQFETLWEPEAPDPEPKGESEMPGGHTLKGMSSPWSPEEDARLLSEWSKSRHRDLAAKMGRTVGALEQRRYKLLEQQERRREEQAMREQIETEEAGPAFVPFSQLPNNQPETRASPGQLGVNYVSPPPVSPSVMSEEKVTEQQTGASGVNGAGPGDLAMIRPTDAVERELVAMLQVHRSLSALDDTERENVVSWILSRYVKSSG